MPSKRRLVTSEICFGTEKAGLLDFTYNKCALVLQNHKLISTFRIFFSEESKMVPLTRSDSVESTQSEREFRKKYQAITHRMVHRKSSAVMYSRILERTFGKTIKSLHNNSTICDVSLFL